ncbi:MAG: hypothetical protein LBP64_01980 [Tannerella sp.]|nr:hypothetical protein [Tannerella sp.]
MKKFTLLFVLPLFCAAGFVQSGTATLFIAGVNATPQNELQRYIIVKTMSGELAAFSPSAVKVQFIENSNWIFELHNGSKYAYPLAEALPFTVERRTRGTGTDVRPVEAAGEWRVYDDGAALVIENPGGEVGHYAVYGISGQLIKSGYESGAKVSVPAPTGLCIVKAGLKAVKAVKK